MTNQVRRVVSIAIFSLGMAGGLFGCAAAPGAIFVIGINDSAPEISALLLPVTLLHTCIIALWERRLASIWLLLLGLIWIFGMAYQRHYVGSVRHFPQNSSLQFLMGEMIPAYFVFALAAFGLLTEHARWPRAIRPRLHEPEI
jgi:hypothetical protein